MGKFDLYGSRGQFHDLDGAAISPANLHTECVERAGIVNPEAERRTLAGGGGSVKLRTDDDGSDVSDLCREDRAVSPSVFIAPGHMDGNGSILTDQVLMGDCDLPGSPWQERKRLDSSIAPVDIEEELVLVIRSVISPLRVTKPPSSTSGVNARFSNAGLPLTRDGHIVPVSADVADPEVLATGEEL